MLSLIKKKYNLWCNLVVFFVFGNQTRLSSTISTDELKEILWKSLLERSIIYNFIRTNQININCTILTSLIDGAGSRHACSSWSWHLVICILEGCYELRASRWLELSVNLTRDKEVTGPYLGNRLYVIRTISLIRIYSCIAIPNYFMSQQALTGHLATSIVISTETCNRDDNSRRGTGLRAWIVSGSWGVHGWDWRGLMKSRQNWN